MARPIKLRPIGVLERALTQFAPGLLATTLLIFGCSGGKLDPTPYPSEVSWVEAVEILNTGEVEMITQLHSLEVTLTMKNGSEIRTVEPTIDAIFQEVEKCGAPCRQILLATE